MEDMGIAPPWRGKEKKKKMTNLFADNQTEKLVYGGLMNFSLLHIQARHQFLLRRGEWTAPTTMGIIEGHHTKNPNILNVITTSDRDFLIKCCHYNGVPDETYANQKLPYKNSVRKRYKKPKYLQIESTEEDEELLKEGLAEYEDFKKLYLLECEDILNYNKDYLESEEDERLIVDRQSFEVDRMRNFAKRYRTDLDVKQSKRWLNEIYEKEALSENREQAELVNSIRDDLYN